MKILIEGKSVEEIFNTLKLKEHSLYKVVVKSTKNNIAHYAFLFTGFKTGSYCEIYTNSYEHPIGMQKVYSIQDPVFLSENKNQFKF